MERSGALGPILASRLEAVARGRGVDLFGIADLSQIGPIPTGLPAGGAGVLDRFSSAVVLGAQYGKLGPRAAGSDVSLFLEGSATAIAEVFEEQGLASLIVHTEDEFDPVQRVGLMSLKALAKAAGLGWQGRSLLAVSPEYGPLHRLIAVLSETELPASEAIPNGCGQCCECVDACPAGALTLSVFDDHPERREDVLDIAECLGDDGCTVCIEACPFAAGATRCS